ncbi:hypothetical protein C7974DRAFT_458839 [Boeremia exigua]|uniref:uncharacterized protein n=1 Tax=Boeremia exigua TaxID=749465 RepID=UPI001E8DAF78|nr:uncharacterized protein C7974DRAFT_458839 [Boeremia exigua]KAH6620564.1 hypothetical protein C7974DRAFT_458839 [Boeremia exigua]
MSPFQTLLAVLALLICVSATPLSQLSARAPPETGGPSRRGVSYNDAKYVAMFNQYGSHVTWAYNWDSRTPPLNTAYEFVPMLHSNRGDHTGKWAADVRAAALANPDAPTHLLGFNEPDTCQPGMGGSCMDVNTAVATWKEYMEPQHALKEKMYLGSPAVTNGAGGLAYLSSFLAACTGCTVDFIAIHWYDHALNAAYFKSHINLARTLAAGRPLWITEFQAAGSDDQVKAFLDEVLPWLDVSADVHRYAYFMASTGDGRLVDNGGASLSNIGQYYAFHA